MTEIGLQNVNTYIQSGNIVFQSSKTKEELINAIQDKIKQAYKFEVPVQIINKEELQQIIQQNPFLKENSDIKFLHITFLTDKPTKEYIEQIKDSQYKEDTFIITEKVVYIYCPGGYGKTKFNNTFFEKKLKVSATTRNWKTSLKLVEMINKYC